MAEELAAPRSLRALRREIRERLHVVDPGLRVVGEEMLGLASPIDLLAVDGEGRAVALLIAAHGQDAELFTRALAQRSWLGPRLRDWAQLAPELGLKAETPVQVVLLAPDFGVETQAAAASLRAGVLRLVRYRDVEVEGRRHLVLDALVPTPAPGVVQPGPQVPESEPLPAFRSGLSEADLGLASGASDDLAGRDS